jgi:integrase
MAQEAFTSTLTNRKRSYEFLKLYLNKGSSPLDREINRQTLQLAQSIKAKRQVDIQNGTYGFTSGFRQDADFIAYFSAQAEKRKENKGNYGNWNSAIKHLRAYAGDKVSFKDVDRDFCEGFREYLKTSAKAIGGKPLASSSIGSYFTKFRACLNQATDDQIIPRNPAIGVQTPRTTSPRKEYLTLDEVRKAVKAPCRYEVLKSAFLFSCLTGLRFSDCKNLTWAEVRRHGSGWRLVFSQQKTKEFQYLDINQQARDIIGKAGKPSEKVFPHLKYDAYRNVALARWMMDAGVTKKITFHCARHTFAVLQLEMGTEIYTVSKLLGHKHLQTTEVYSQIVDAKKLEAVNRIPTISL